MKKVTKSIVSIIVVAALGAGGYLYWQHQKLFPSTDDAYIQAHVVNIAPQINGEISSVSVKDQEHINKGQLLFTIDPTPYQLSYNKAKAQYQLTQEKIKAAEMAVNSAQALVSQREAELKNVERDTHRVLIMVRKKYLAQSDGDDAVKNLRVSKAALLAAKSQLAQAEQQRGKLGPKNAQLLTAKAAVATAKLNLAYTKVYAPSSGYISNFDLRRGAEVSAYQPLFAIVEDNTIWAEANFKETDMARVKPGQKATIKVDMYPGKVFTGKVDSISNSSGSTFSLLPPENASGNWVKVTQRFPIKVIIAEKSQRYPLRMGASCKVVIDTKPLPTLPSRTKEEGSNPASRR